MRPRLLVPALAAACCAAAARAAPQLTGPHVTLSPAPGGDPDAVTVLFEPDVAYTLRRVWWRGVEVLEKTGFNGQVVWFNDTGGTAGWVGTGHTEGGAELVDVLELTVDGAPVPMGPAFTGTTYAQSFELHKESTLETLTGVRTSLYADVSFAAGELRESARIVFTEPADVGLVYGFMHTWPDTSSLWAAERRSDGQVLTGAFSLTGSQPSIVIQDDVEWIATLYPASAHVTVTAFHLQNPNLGGLRHLFVDNTTYHKQYYSAVGDDVVMPAGSTLAFGMSTTFRDDVPGQDWIAAADVAAAALGPVLLADADRDLLPDAWELAWLPTLAALGATPLADWDGDGATDLVEEKAGTDPTDPADAPGVGAVRAR